MLPDGSVTYVRGLYREPPNQRVKPPARGGRLVGGDLTARESDPSLRSRRSGGPRRSIRAYHVLATFPALATA